MSSKATGKSSDGGKTKSSDAMSLGKGLNAKPMEMDQHSTMMEMNKSMRQETEQAQKLLRDAKSLHRASLISIDSGNESKLIEVKTGCCGMDPTTGRGKQIHLIQMLLLPFIPVMALIAQNTINMVTVLDHQHDMQESIEQVQLSTDLGNVTDALQSERAEIAFFLFTNGSVIQRNLSEHFHYTNQLINDLEWPNFRFDDDLFQNKIVFRIRLDDFRDKISKLDFEGNYSIEAGIKFYNRANYIFLDQLTSEIKEKDASGVWRLLLAYKNMIRAIEHLGISMVFGEQYFGRGRLDQRSYIAFVTNDALGQDYLNQSQNFAYWIKDRYDIVQKSYPWYSNITRRRLEIIRRGTIEPDFDKATEYFYAMLGYLDSLKKVQYELRANIEQLIMNEMKNSKKQVILGIVVLCIVVIISPIIILLVRMVTRTLQAFSETLLYKTHELGMEKTRTDRLLYQMLPPRVAEQLKRNRKVSAETYQSVTIYFSDIVGFTELASESTPMQVISLLNGLYRMFDSRIDMYDVYKIETIGEVYMVASGVHQRTQKNHSSEIASMSLSLLHGAENFVVPHIPGERLKIRIGLHTGAVVAGVVGTIVPRYCLFGDTVNTASRMESTGLPFKIHISLDTKTELDQCGGYLTKLRGEIEIKGKGLMETFWLVGKHGYVDPMEEDQQPQMPPPAEGWGDGEGVQKHAQSKGLGLMRLCS